MSGEVISVYQLVIPNHSLIPTHKGKPMAKIYFRSIVYVDHYSDFTYVHLMSKIDAEDTVKANM